MSPLANSAKQQVLTNMGCKRNRRHSTKQRKEVIISSNLIDSDSQHLTSFCSYFYQDECAEAAERIWPNGGCYGQPWKASHWLIPCKEHLVHDCHTATTFCVLVAGCTPTANSGNCEKLARWIWLPCWLHLRCQRGWWLRAAFADWWQGQN